MTTYYVRIQGRVIGPLKVEQVRAMKAKGQIHRFHEISVDKINWHTATEFADLFPESESVSSKAHFSDVELPSTSRVSAPHRDSTRPARYVMLGIVVLLVGAAGVGIWINLKSTGTTSERTPSQPVAEAQPSGKPASKADNAKVGKEGTREPTSIISGHDEDELAKAIGLVACGLEFTSPSGQQWVKCLSTGSCFAVSKDGHLLTNRHVVKNIRDLKRSPDINRFFKVEGSWRILPKVWIFLNKKKHECLLAHVDDDFDFAVLKIATATPVFFRLSDSQKIARQTKVCAYGFPGVAQTALSSEEERAEIARSADKFPKAIDGYFKPRDLDFSSSSGVVSRMANEETGRVWIEHDATINHGNSGGPLVAEDGTVVGINTRGVDGTGVFWALSLRQLKDEIGKHSPNSVWK